MAKEFGKYETAFFAMLRSGKKRPARDERFAAWAEKEIRPALRELFTIVAEYDPGANTVGDLTFWNDTIGDRVPDAADSDRSDVVCIGATHGGDLFVVAAPGEKAEAVTAIIHDDGWCDGDSWADLEDFLEDRVVSYRETMQEDYPDDESEWKTDLDPFLASG
jgi:hypothetical protein